jgi:NitT/TauT family transport system substrate-binding protein
MKLQAILRTAIAALGASVAFVSSAQTPTLKVGLPSVSMFTVVHRIAADGGYFEREGVKVENQHFESGSINMRALLARAVDVSDVETALILGAVGNGADLRVMGTHCQGLHFALYAKKDIKNLKDLQGKSFGISGIGGLPHVVILALLDRQGLSPDPVKLLTVGGTGARLKSLIAGKIDATLGEFSPTVEADPNLHRLMIISQELPLYMAQGLAVWADTLPAKRDALERWQRGLVKATRWAYENKDAFVAAAAKHLPTDPKELATIYDSYIAARVWAINGEIEPKRLAYMQELGVKTKTQTKQVDLDKLAMPEVTQAAIKSIGTKEYPPAKR